jgi:hypothetical protein
MRFEQRGLAGLWEALHSRAWIPAGLCDQHVFAVQVYGDLSSSLKSLISSATNSDSDATSTLDLLDKEAVQQQGPEVVLVVLGNQVSSQQLYSM